MKNHEKRWQTKKNDEKPREMMKNQEKPRKTMKNQEKQYKTMKNQDKRWKTMKNQEKLLTLYWLSTDFYCSATNSSFLWKYGHIFNKNTKLIEYAL